MKHKTGHLTSLRTGIWTKYLLIPKCREKCLEMNVVVKSPGIAFLFYSWIFPIDFSEHCIAAIESGACKLSQILIFHVDTGHSPNSSATSRDL